MRFILVTSQYPSEENLYANGFVHSRVLEYIKRGIEINVYVNDKSVAPYQYEYQGVSVKVGNKSDLAEFINKFNPDKILVHFLDRHLMNIARNMDFKYPMRIWVHGSEALGWYRRLFNIDIKFPVYMLKNTIQMVNLRRFINETKDKDIKFIFVSEWMKKIMESDTKTKVENYDIIPNYIDQKHFKFKNKNEDLRKHILMIRPFNSRKYANDIAIKSILELTNRDFFYELKITIIGKGKDFNRMTEPLKKFKNIEIRNTFLNKNEIYEEHLKNGIFLCPTRQDAQGVSMCEAMSSGLVPITSDNTAIPEFVEEGKSGFLTKNYNEIADKIEYLYNNTKCFLEMSQNASAKIQNKCSNDIVINKEVNLIKN